MRPAAVRPPWSANEDAFLRLCTRCIACIEVCPADIIVCGDGGYPVVDFSRGECTFCADCVTVCRDGALQRREGAAPWQVKAEVGKGCLALRQVECRVCGEQCAVRAIRFRLQAGRIAAPALDADICNGCGACIAACPAGAIAVREPRATVA